MPWSSEGGGGGRQNGNNGGGPWGQQGPWGQGGGNQQPTDFDDMIRRGQDRMKRVIRGGGGGRGGGGAGDGGVPKPFLFLLAFLLIAGAAFYGFFFRVNPDEQGVVLRFGEFNRWEGPGLHFRWPYPVEEVHLPKVTQQRTIEVGMRRAGGDSNLMLTGDGAIADIRFVVFWRIKPDPGVDPTDGQTPVAQFLFNIAKPELTVREVAESAMREIVGQSELQPLLTAGRQKTQTAVQEMMQRILDSYRSGIKIDQIQLREVDPPEAVIAAFRDVAAAEQDRERLIKEAQTYADQIIPRARGNADRITAAAEGYRDQTVAEAQGQSARYLQVLREYQKQPDVTRQRLFLEMQEHVLSGADKIILDSAGGNGSGVVPYLPLEQLQRRSTTTPDTGNGNTNGGQQ